MGNKGLLFVLVIVAAAAAFWLLGGADLFRSDTSGDDGDGATNGAGTLGAGGPGEGAAAEDEKARGPVLFGRARAEDNADAFPGPVRELWNDLLDRHRRQFAASANG